MKINNSIVSGPGGKPSATPTTGNGPVERASNQNPQPPAGQSSAASVSLSPLSAQMAALESSLAAGEPFDAARVEEIKQAIRDGSLTVNAEVVASKMLAGLREMYGGDK